MGSGRGDANRNTSQNLELSQQYLTEGQEAIAPLMALLSQATSSRVSEDPISAMDQAYARSLASSAMQGAINRTGGQRVASSPETATPINSLASQAGLEASLQNRQALTDMLPVILSAFQVQQQLPLASAGAFTQGAGTQLQSDLSDVLNFGDIGRALGSTAYYATRDDE